MSLLTKVAIPTGILVGVALVAMPDQEHVAQTAQASTPATPPDALAREYAASHGLTDCVAPKHAFTQDKDVVLTIAVDDQLVPTTSQIVPVTLDEALQSGEHSRLNVVACSKAGE